MNQDKSKNCRFTATKAFKLMLNEINDLAGQHEVPICSILLINSFADKKNYFD